MAIKIAFLGLGGVGRYFGAKLARTYSQSKEVEVVFLAREKTAEITSKNGISLTTPQEEFVAHPRKTSSDPNAIGVVDFLIVSVKSYDLEESLAQFSACVGPHTIILPLLNGVDAPQRIRQLFPSATVWQGCVYIVSRFIEPGIIKETGNIHSLYFGGDASQTEKLHLLEHFLKQAHHEIFFSRNINEVIWGKFVFISTIASLTCYLDKCIGEILANVDHRKLLVELLSEVVAVASANQIALPENIVPLTISKMEKLPFETTSSMHSDFKKGNRTEHNSITGYVVKMAQQFEIDCPNYRQIHSSLKQRQL